MTREEAQEYAKTMTFRDAIFNLKRARSIPYRKATFIKIHELLMVVEQEPNVGHWIMHDKHRECSRCNIWLTKDMTRNSYCPNCGAKME